MLPLRRILVPVDFSPHSDRALECAIALARASGAEVAPVVTVRAQD